MPHLFNWLGCSNYLDPSLGILYDVHCNPEATNPGVTEKVSITIALTKTHQRVNHEHLTVW